MVTIYNNFLPEEYFDHISKIALSESDMPWFFSESVSGIEINNSKYDKNKQYGFSHVLFMNEPNSSLFNDFTYILQHMAEKYSINIFNLKRMRLGMQLKIADQSIINYPHVDYDEPHQVLLLYLNESDGDTIFYNADGSILRTVSPCANTAVLFDGNIRHSSSTPLNYSRRIALNINFNLIESENNDCTRY